MNRILTLALLALLAFSVPAHAGPLGALVSLLATPSLGTLSFAGSALLGGLARGALSIGLSLLSQALNKPKTRGTVIGQIDTGEAGSQRIPLGRVATSGHLVWHGAHGAAGKTPNAYYTLVIALSAAPGAALRRVAVGGEWITLGGTAHPDFGAPMTEKASGGADYGWVKYYDGTQTAADPMLVAAHATDTDQPWTEDHIGTGWCYAIVTLRYNPAVWKSVPALVFELDGIPVYDPRLDSTAGGSGAQRWNDPATWATSVNLAVLAYNVARGIPLPGGDVFGGDFAAEGVPFANWVAAMNACDTVVGAGPDARPQFRGGIEVALPEAEPAAVVEELLAAALGQIAEDGGVLRLRIGAPADPVMTITDRDWVIDATRVLDPFPGLNSTHNLVRASHPSESALWQTVQTEPMGDPAWQVADGDRRLIQPVSLPACFSHQQARQVAEALARDARRFVTITGVLPPDYQQLEVLDSVALSSTRWGFDDAVFEVVAVERQPDTLLIGVTLRQRDPDDYTIPAVDNGPLAGAAVAPPARQIGAGDWSVTAGAVADAAAIDRRPALVLAWDVDTLEDAEALDYEVQVDATEAPVTGGVAGVAGGGITVSDGVLPSTAYRVRVKPVLPGADWSDWATATTGAVLLVRDDLDQGAATDYHRQTISGEFNITDISGGAYGGSWHTAATISLGATALGDQWRLHAYVDRRSQTWPNPAPPPDNLRATGGLQVLFRVNDGTSWSGWVGITGSERSLFSPWDHMDVTAVIGFVAADIEVRVDLRATGADPDASGVARTDLFRNLALTAERSDR